MVTPPLLPVRMPVSRAADGFAALAPLLSASERPARYVDHEWGAHRDPDAAYRAALVYPDTYEIGMANQALAILYARMNAMEVWLPSAPSCHGRTLRLRCARRASR